MTGAAELRPDTLLELRPRVRVVEIDSGVLVVDEESFTAAEVNVSGRLILEHCAGGARLDEVVQAFADEAECSPGEAGDAVRDFVAAAAREGWISIDSGDWA